MCTAITYSTKNHYFGRNLDFEMTFNEQVVCTPRHFPLNYKCLDEKSFYGEADFCKDSHYAILGMAVVADEYPLYFDALNEKGLAMAGLHFVGNAFYAEPGKVSCNSEKGESADCKTAEIAPYELIAWVLSQCETVEQARSLLEHTRPVAVPFSEEFPLSPLHFMIADKEGSIVVEPVHDGLKIYDNPVGVLTNNPPFPFHLEYLKNYMNLTAEIPVNRFSGELPLSPYSRGMGALGLPGDNSSSSRFVRAAFVRANSVSGEGEKESVNQFFHILGSVEQVRGTVRLENGMYEITTYSCCCNLEEGIYYYRTYEDATLRKTSIWEMNPEGEALVNISVI